MWPYELGAEPRGIEGRLAVVHVGLSMFVRGDAVAAVAQRFPRVRSQVAELLLEPNRGFCIDHTGSAAQRTVWGRPLQLLAAVVDIVSVETHR